MVSFSRASSVEAIQADVQSCWIILGVLDKAVRPAYGVGAILWSQNIAYNLLCRLTGQLWEDEALVTCQHHVRGYYRWVFYRLRECACKTCFGVF